MSSPPHSRDDKWARGAPAAPPLPPHSVLHGDTQFQLDARGCEQRARGGFSRPRCEESGLKEEHHEVLDRLIVLVHVGLVSRGMVEGAHDQVVWVSFMMRSMLADLPYCDVQYNTMQHGDAATTPIG